MGYAKRTPKFVPTCSGVYRIQFVVAFSFHFFILRSFHERCQQAALVLVVFVDQSLLTIGCVFVCVLISLERTVSYKYATLLRCPRLTIAVFLLLNSHFNDYTAIGNRSPFIIPLNGHI